MLNGSICTAPHLNVPDVAQVFAACMNCYDAPRATLDLFVDLKGSHRMVMALHVGKIAHESGTRGMLILKGSLKEPVNGHTRFQAFYNASTGTGNITLLKDNEKA